jgi:hypothetical protein
MPKKKGVKQYRVGTDKNADFTPLEMENLILRLTAWFRSPECDRQFDDPEGEAKEVIRQCLLAEKKDGTPWRNCPQEFSKRVKVKAMYDLETHKGIAVSSVKHPDAQRKLNAQAQEEAKDLLDMRVGALNFSAEEFRAREERNIFVRFPELDNPVHKAHVRRLSLLYAQQEMLDIELSKNLTGKKLELTLGSLKAVEDMADKTMKLLGIHPDQLHKRLEGQRQGGLGELVASIEDDAAFPKRTKMWALQEAYQLWWMTQHPNGRGDGPQLEPWELWHLTRTKEIQFKCKCGCEYTLIAGWEPDELKEYLLRNGMVLDQPVVPGLFTPEDLQGIMDDKDIQLLATYDVESEDM